MLELFTGLSRAVWGQRAWKKFQKSSAGEATDPSPSGGSQVLALVMGRSTTLHGKLRASTTWQVCVKDWAVAMKHSWTNARAN